MSFDYSRMEDVANRLVKKFGTVGYIIRSEIAEGEPNPKPWEGTGQPETVVTAYPCNIVIGAYNGVELANTAIQINDVKIMIVKEGLEIEPTVNDQIQLSDEDRAFQIVSVRAIMPGGYIVYWETQAR